jgi:hypothetical protein
MSSVRQSRGSVRNDRMQLTDAERATIDALNDASVAGARAPEGYEVLAESRKSLAKETREALRSAIPDLEERGRAHAKRFGPELEKLKGTGWPVRDSALPESPRPVALAFAPSIGAALGDRLVIGHHPPDLVSSLGHAPPVFHPPTQPANVGELWWAETDPIVTAPANTLSVDLDNDPYRLWGHIAYTSDNLFNGGVGIVMTFILSPDRLPRTDRTVFDVHPELRTGGWVSGWTGQYHPVWHADDKWSKCWHYCEATLTLSSGERLAGDSLHENLFFLEDVNPVGQASINEFQGWTPVLTFTANMADLRQRGISIILRTELRYDFQLEGESDIWFRNRPGSESESVAAFDNALTFRCAPGSVPV